MSKELNYSVEDMRRAWEDVGQNLRQAMVEVSHRIGGQEMAEKVIELADSSHNILPDGKAIEFLEVNYPGAGGAVLTRAEEIQEMRLDGESNVS